MTDANHHDFWVAVAAAAPVIALAHVVAIGRSSRAATDKAKDVAKEFARLLAELQNLGVAGWTDTGPADPVRPRMEKMRKAVKALTSTRRLSATADGASAISAACASVALIFALRCLAVEHDSFSTLLCTWLTGAPVAGLFFVVLLDIVVARKLESAAGPDAT